MQPLDFQWINERSEKRPLLAYPWDATLLPNWESRVEEMITYWQIYTKMICNEMTLIFPIFANKENRYCFRVKLHLSHQFFNSFLHIQLLANFISINLTFDTHASHGILLEAFDKDTPTRIQMVSKFLKVHFSISHTSWL